MSTQINSLRPTPRGPNHVAVPDSDWAFVLKKTITFAGGTSNAIGDYDGTGDPFVIFNVSGEVLARVLAVCTYTLEGASAVLEVGTRTDTAEIIAQTTATDITAGDLWHDNAPDSNVELSTVMSEYVVANGADIVGSIGTANITGGIIDFYCFWYPLSEDGNVRVAAEASPSVSKSPSASPSASPSTSPSVSASPSVSPSISPSASPSVSPSESPSVSVSPSASPSTSPSSSPSTSPSKSPSASPSVSPSTSPSRSESPSISPSASPSASPSVSLSVSPSVSPSPSA